MSRTRRYLHGISTSYLYQLIAFGCGLWLTRFLLRRVGAEEYGQWLIILQVVSYLELLDLGVIAVVPRQVAYITGGSDPAAIPANLTGFLTRVVALVRVQSLAVGLATLVVWLLVTRGQTEHPMAWPLLAIGLCYVLLFPLRVCEATLRGLQDLGYLGVVNIVLWLTQAGLTVAFVLAGWGLWAIVAAWIVYRCLQCLCWWLRLRLAFAGLVSGVLARFRPEGGWGLLKQGIWVTVGRLAHVLGNGTQLLIIGWLLGPVWVVVYSCTAKFAQIGSTQVQSLILGAEPALSELKTAASPEHLTGVLTALCQLVLLVAGLLACVLLPTNGPFVAWWVGADQYGGEALTLLLLAEMLVRNFVLCLLTTLFCLGFERWLAYLTLTDAVARLLLTAALIGRFGVASAPVASLVGACVICLPVCLFILERHTPVFIGSIVRSLLPWLAIFVVLALALYALQVFWAPRGALELVASGAAVGCVYWLIMLPVLRRSAAWEHIKPRLRVVGAMLSRFLFWRAGQKPTRQSTVS